MKKNYVSLFFIILSFIMMRSFSYQPAEQGLLFGEKVKTSLRKTGISRNKQQSNVMNFVTEKRADGSDSQVLKINGLSQFLVLSTKCLKPIILRVFSEDKQYREIFQNVAERFSDKMVFASFDSFSNLALVQIFFTVLKSKGILMPSDNDIYPIFLFCSPDFVVLQNDSVGFTKESLKLLGIRFLKGEKDFSDIIQKTYAQKIAHSSGSTEEQATNLSKKSELNKHEAGGLKGEKPSFWQRLKNWGK